MGPDHRRIECGLGVEFAELLAAQKVNLVLAARRKEPMEKLADDLRRRHGVDILVEPTDLATPGAAAGLKNSLDEKSIEIDILVNNAGYGLQGEFLKTPIKRTTDMIQLNVTALTELSYVFGRAWLREDRERFFLSPAYWLSSPSIATLLMRLPSPTYFLSVKLCTTNFVRKAWLSPAFARGTLKLSLMQLLALGLHRCCACSP